MKSSKWILLPIIGAVTVMVCLYATGPGAGRVPASTVNPAKKVRLYNKRLRRLDGFQYPGSAVHEWAARGDLLFILDGESQEISIFGPGGNRLKTLGKSGEAPWENRQTQHLWVDTEGYATIDNSHMVIKKYAHNDELLYYRKLSDPIWDGVYLGHKQFFLMDDEPADPGFFTVNAHSGTTGERISLVSLLESVPESDYLNVVYEGQLMRNENHIVYMCARTGSFFVFDIHGAYRYTGHTLDNTPPPEVRARKSGNVTYFVREPDININYSGTLDQTHFYILSLISWKETETLTIDAYDLTTGSYDYSMPVPNLGKDLPVEILCGNGGMVVLYEGQQIVRYAMEKT